MAYELSVDEQHLSDHFPLVAVFEAVGELGDQESRLRERLKAME